MWWGKLSGNNTLSHVCHLSSRRVAGEEEFSNDVRPMTATSTHQ